MDNSLMSNGGLDGKNVITGILQLSDVEREVLAVYDRLEKVELESRYLEALQSLTEKNEVVSVTEDDIAAAKAQLLEAKALYTLRTSIIESVLVANPVLKAVHAGTTATPIERDLLPAIQARDDISIRLSDTSAKTLATRDALLKLQIENAEVAKNNSETASTMLELAEHAKAQDKEIITDSKVRARLDKWEVEVKASRQRWRLMKGVASAVVAGSGADWARDRNLRDLVLDDDGED